jgi:hypothetical protein
VEPSARSTTARTLSLLAWKPSFQVVEQKGLFQHGHEVRGAADVDAGGVEVVDGQGRAALRTVY